MLQFRRLSGLPYLGGKSGNAPAGTGRWIARQLPEDARCYMEPFCGMLGVLLQRPRAEVEIANDLRGDAVNWWRVVSTDPIGLEMGVAGRLHARSEFEAARDRIRNVECPPGGAGDLDRAVDWEVMIQQSIGSVGQTWSCSTSTAGGNRKVPIPYKLLRDRVRHVQWECRDAIEVIDIYGDEHTLIYADPPYPGTSSAGYAKVDQDALDDVLLASPARVAVSGYAGDRPRLEEAGWHVQYRKSKTSVDPKADTNAERVEALWTNYPPFIQQELI